MSLIKIWKEKGKILEGIKNKVFKKEHIEQIYEERLKVCSSCEEVDDLGSKCVVRGTGPCCGLCGCSLGLKLRSLASECPANKWQAITSEEEEDLINNQLDE
jgi:hypothetical protein